MIRLTDIRGNECWVRSSDVKAIMVGPRVSVAPKPQRTRIFLSIEKDGAYLDVLESPGEIAERMKQSQSEREPFIENAGLTIMPRAEAS